MQVTLRRHTAADAPELVQMLHRCKNEIAVIDGWPAADASHSRERMLNDAFDARCHTYLVELDKQCAGFALVGHESFFGASVDAHIVLMLYIEAAQRGKRYGTSAATQLFALHPGHWEVATSAANVPATAFWRAVVSRITDGQYVERWSQNATFRGNVEIFQINAAAPQH